jgi:adenosylhomocysteine nucleosidase
MSAHQVEFGFVAALEREVAGLVREWTTTNAQFEGASRAIYRNSEAALICSGTGAERAYAGAKLLIEKFAPRVVISIGFAGSCRPDLQPGSVVVPESVLEAATGRIFKCAFGQGQLVTLDRVAGKAMKQQVAARFGALAVDMEAAGVAAAAAEHNREFAAIKVISDGAEDDLGFLSSFVKPEGFETGRFIAHIALRPGLWPKVAALQRNSRLAAVVLRNAVSECMSDWRIFSAEHSPAASQI